MDTIVTEPRVTLDPRFFGKNIIILALEISYNLSKTDEGAMSAWTNHELCRCLPSLVVDLISKSRCIDDGQGNSGSLLVKF